MDGSASVTERFTIYPLTKKVEIEGKGKADDASDSVLNGKTVYRMLTSKNATFKATTSPDGAYEDAFKWTSSNKSVAEVDQDGKVTFHKAGAVTIKAAARDGSGKTAKFTLRITK